MKLDYSLECFLNISANVFIIIYFYYSFNKTMVKGEDNGNNALMVAAELYKEIISRKI